MNARTVRFMTSLLFAGTVLVCLESCRRVPPGPHDGTSGYPCRRADDSRGACDSGLTCLGVSPLVGDRGHCSPCGESGGACCGGGGCRDGLTCEVGSNRCNACGAPGQRCCDQGGLYQVCNGSSVCGPDALCTSAPTPTTCRGSAREVRCRQPGSRCLLPVVLAGDTLSDVRECAESMGCDLVEEPGQYFPFCVKRLMMGTLVNVTTYSDWNTSLDDSRTCTEAVNVGDVVTDGCCPGEVTCVGGS